METKLILRCVCPEQFTKKCLSTICYESHSVNKKCVQVCDWELAARLTEHPFLIGETKHNRCVTWYLQLHSADLQYMEICMLFMHLKIRRNTVVLINAILELHVNKYNIKNPFFWDMASCGSCNNRCFEESRRLLLQVTKNQREKKNVSRLLTDFFLYWRWRRLDPSKRRFIQDPHGATFLKKAFFIVTAVKTSNPTNIT
jgi:hypothetical protein